MKCDEHEFLTMDNKCDCKVHFERKSGKCESIFGYCNQTFQCRNKKFKCSDKTKGYCKPNCGYSTDENCEMGCQSTYEDECIPIVQCDDNLKCYGEQVCSKDGFFKGQCHCPEGIPDKKYYCTHSITTTFESPSNDMPDYEDFKILKYFLIANTITIAISLALPCVFIIRDVKKRLRTPDNQQNPGILNFIL